MFKKIFKKFSFIQNKLDKDWARLNDLSDSELCKEFDEYLDTKPRSDYFRRICQQMALRYYGKHN